MKKNPENPLGFMTHGGFTLLEVLFALTILSIALLGLASLTATVIRSNSFSGDFSTASALAQDKLEDLTNTSFNDTVLSDSNTDNNSASGLLSTTETDKEDSNNPIDENGDPNNPGSKYTRIWNIWDVSSTRKDITVIVSWQDSRGNNKKITLSTIRSDT